MPKTARSNCHHEAIALVDRWLAHLIIAPVTICPLARRLETKVSGLRELMGVPFSGSSRYSRTHSPNE